MCEALVQAGKRGLRFETQEPVNRQVQEQLTALYWYANNPQKIRVYARLAREFPESPWRTGWLAASLTCHAKEKQDAEVEAVERELFAKPLDMAGRYRVARAYLEASLKPEKALALMEEALALRDAAAPPDAEPAREMWVTETSVWRAYLAFAYSEAGKFREGNRFWEAESETAEFEDVTDAAGLAGTGSGRVAVGDFDGDGWDDLSLNGDVWRNRKGVFERVEAVAARGASSLWGDADNDGDPDLWVFSMEKGCLLFVNEDGKFTEAPDTGLAGKLESQPEGVGLGDANGDGFLDAYVAVYEAGDLGGGRPDRFFLSSGSLRWSDALESAGMGEERRDPLCGRGVNWGDFDDDGDADVFVSNYRLQRNYLWRNDGGRFANAAPALGVEGVGTDSGGARWYGHTIGSCWADLDNDLDLDLVSANLAHPRFIEFSNKTQVLMNQGRAKGWTFVDIFPWSGIPYEETHSDVSACDYDNDGDLDLFFTSVYRERPSWLLRNDGRAHFTPVSWRAGVVQFNGWGHAWLDFDNDGDQDLLVCAGGRVKILRNGLEDESGWLQVALKAKARGGVGARVTVRCGDLQQTREIAAGRGTSSQDSARAHFGFGKRGGPVAVTVRWPGGKLQRVEGVELNRVIEVAEPD